MNVDTALIDTATSTELRTTRVTAPATDSVLLQDRLLEAVLGMLEMPVAAAERRALVPRDTAVGPAGALYLQGRGYLQYFERPENVDRAIDAFDGALKLDSTYARAFAARGEAYWRKSDFGERQRWIEAAVASCAQALVFDAALASAHACLGQVNNATGRYEAAALDFERALERDPTDDDAYAGLALANERLNRIEDAEKIYQRAIALRPHYWVNHNRLGHFYYSQGRYPEAVHQFTQVVALAPDSFRGYSNLGGTLVLTGQYDEAISALRRSVEIRPDAAGFSNLGTAYFNRGRFEDAAATFEQAVKLADTNYELWGNLADAQYFIPPLKAQAATSYRKAITLAAPDLKVNPRNHLVLINLANYHAMVGERSQAATFLDRALAVAPKDGFVLFRAAIALHQLGEQDRALDALARAVAAGFPKTTVLETPNFNDLWQDPRFQKLVRGQ
jgi:serine/threonine-protein kinase